MAPTLKRIGLVGSVAAMLLAVPARAGDFVVVSAQAIPQYHRGKAPADRPQAESYVFSQGKFFGGVTRDQSQEKATFDGIVKTLAGSLAKQNYYPSKDPATAQLLIIVHWGTTRTYEDPNKELNVERMNSALSDYKNSAGADGDADPGAINQISNEASADASLQSRFMSQNAELLGYKRSLREKSQRIFASEEEKTMRQELNEERYFIVLMAYDYQLIKTQKKPQLLWTTHMSVRAAGTNFTIALPQMAQVAASFYGRDQADPVHVETTLKEGKVQVGEPTVVHSDEHH